MHKLLDRFGTVFAGLCAVHCALVPLFVATSSSFMLALLSWRDPHHAFAIWLLRMSTWEGWVIGTALGFAAVSIVFGIRIHRSTRPALLLLGALVSFVAALYSPMLRTPELHAGLAVVGGALLASAHMANLRAVRFGRDRMRAQDGDRRACGRTRA